LIFASFAAKNFMKKIAILSFGIFSIFSLIGCSSNSTQPVAPNTNTAVVINRNQMETVTAHSTEKSMPPMSSSNAAGAANKPASGSSESPMARAIDVSAQTAKIEKAEKDYKAKASDDKAKENLASAYFERAFRLTEAAQYRAALGDFRKGLKLNPNDTEAKAMHDQIIEIFKSIPREPPKEGEEPAPLPFNKG